MRGLTFCYEESECGSRVLKGSQQRAVLNKERSGSH